MSVMNESYFGTNLYTYHALLVLARYQIAGVKPEFEKKKKTKKRKKKKASEI